MHGSEFLQLFAHGRFSKEGAVECGVLELDNSMHTDKYPNVDTSWHGHSGYMSGRLAYAGLAARVS